MPSSTAIRPGSVPTEALLQFVDEVADHAIFFLDPEGRVSSWNAGARRLKGYADEEVLGKTMDAFYPPTELALRKPQFERRVAASRGRFEDEGWRVRKDGTMFWASVSLTALRGADGELIGYACIVRDLTGRKHAEEALRQSEERFRTLTRSVKDYAIFMLDPRGHIVSWNEGARALKGYEEPEIIGEHFSRFYLPDDLARGHPAKELEIAVREGRYQEEGWRVRKDGTRFWANVTITALHDSAGRHVGFTKVTRDLTARKEAEEELRASARSYAALNRELDAFTHTVAHDLRSPIRAAEHLVSVLLEEEHDRLSEDGRQTLRDLHATSLSMAKLVQDLLDLSKAGAARVRREPVDVSRLAKEAASDVLTAHPGRTVDLRIAPDLSASADPGLVRLALANLLSNALKFTRLKPRPLIEVGAKPTPEGLAFFVRDNGVGFDPAAAPGLFQPFTRLHPAHEFEGTGVGLATVHRIVTRHGGHVWVEARPGEGATFHFTLSGDSP